MSTERSINSINLRGKSKKKAVKHDVNKVTERHIADDCNRKIDNDYIKENIFFPGTSMKLSIFNRTVLGKNSIKDIRGILNYLCHQIFYKIFFKIRSNCEIDLRRKKDVQNTLKIFPHP